MKKILIMMMAVATLSLSLYAQEFSEAETRRFETLYPRSYDVEIPAGTKLAVLAMRYRRLVKVPLNDTQDEGAYPLWYRNYLREKFPNLPKEGKYQYPRVAAQILEWMLAHPNFKVPPAKKIRGKSKRTASSRTMSVGTNINLTNLEERNSESFIAVDYADPQHLIAGSNNISGSGRQKQFWSSDGGLTWSSTELPLTAGAAFHSDPAVAWTTDGTAWVATLGIGNVAAGTAIKVQVYKSTDRGATWNFVETISTGNDNDKELMWIDTHPTSPYKDNIYVAWDIPGQGMRFARSTDKGETWSSVSTLSDDSAIGAHLTTGPSGELYVVWPDVASGEIRMRKSTDGGANFAAMKKIADTNDAYEISIPATCRRKVLIYVSVGVDRSDGPRKGQVYVAWTDRNGTDADPDCHGVDSESNANIYFSRSVDGGNTWSTPAIIHGNPAKTDQFNQWLDVDPENGAIHVIFYDTRDDVNRKKTHIYYIRSDDGGTTWVDETRVTSAPTDETGSPADLGNQYGDYNGLAVYRNVAHPVWTDRRTGVPGDKEQIFTAKIGDDSGEMILTLQPATIDIDDVGDSEMVIAALKDGNGASLPGVVIQFASNDPNIATITPSTAVTNVQGIAKVTVTGVNKGKTDVGAKAQNKKATARVKVPSVSFFGLLILSFMILLTLFRRRPEVKE